MHSAPIVYIVELLLTSAIDSFVDLNINWLFEAVYRKLLLIVKN